MSEIQPNHLLDVARTLLPPATRGPLARDLEATVRRSISTSYYAAFTKLSGQLASYFAVGPDAPVNARRILTHTAAVEVCKPLAAQNIPWSNDECHAHLATFAKSYIELYDLRLSADYDHLYTPTHNDARTSIKRAERALQTLDLAQAECPDQLATICVSLIAGRSLGRLKR